MMKESGERGRGEHRANRMTATSSILPRLGIVYLLLAAGPESLRVRISLLPEPSNLINGKLFFDINKIAYFSQQTTMTMKTTIAAVRQTENAICCYVVRNNETEGEEKINK